MDITEKLVEKLIKEQFPCYSEFKIKIVEKSGHDNRTFHLGEKMSVRLPSRKEYSGQVEKEARWLPIFKDKITINIQSPIKQGKPNKDYPFKWSINEWIEGETVNYKTVKDLNTLAIDIAKFLKELQAIDASEGPKGGLHNYYRGCSLEIYEEETLEAIEKLKNIFDKELLMKIWNKARESEYYENGVWIHGDMAINNLLVLNGRLKAVIDFGVLGVGDPACDYVLAWTFFKKDSRRTFLWAINSDRNTINRAKGWALWKALISYDLENKTSDMSLWAKNCINELIEDEI